jgi:hypothetical protein
MSAIIPVRSILLADADVSAMVGTRIGPDHFGQDTIKPAVCLWHISGEPYDCLDGGTGFENGRVRVECLSDTRVEADDLCRKVNIALVKSPKRGVWDSVYIDSISQGSGIAHLADRPLNGSQTWLYRTIQSFDVLYHLYQRD